MPCHLKELTIYLRMGKIRDFLFGYSIPVSITLRVFYVFLGVVAQVMVDYFKLETVIIVISEEAINYAYN